MLWRLCAVLLFTSALPLFSAKGLPSVPVGLDAYRRWEKWPQQRIGVRAYMRSTYDRQGRNEAADASHFLYQTANDRNVTLDLEGRGILYFARYNHWHGSPWYYGVDGNDYLVQESSSADPDHPKEGSVFLPENAFPNPLTWTWSVTKGADLMWVPIAFERSFQMSYSRTHYGTGYYIYHQFVEGISLSEPIRSWNTSDVPSSDVVQLIGRAGEDPGGATPGAVVKGKVALRGRQEIAWIKAEKKPMAVTALTFTVARDRAIEFGRTRLRVTWDNRPEASIDAPVALFFGAGTLYNRDNREYLVKAFPVSIRFTEREVKLACYFPMPFFKNARIELVSENEIPELQYAIRLSRYDGEAKETGYFHATYRDFPHPEAGKDLVLLDTGKTERGGDWSGSFVGTSFIFSDRANLTTLEGDPRFFFDDGQTPQAYGTGTEEWGGGGDYWGGRNMTLPFAGHPCGARNEKEAKNDEDKIESAYRFLLADLMPFGRNAVIRLEHGGENDSTEHYQTVTYWYGAPSASLVKTDTLQVGDLKSEKKHSYRSEQASAPYEIASRFEWGPDTLKGKEVFPAHTEKGRRTKGSSEFTLQIKKENLGVMLRRTLDYQFPNQRAEVFIADAKERQPQWKKAGLWYLAGGNSCVYSNPKSETGPAEHQVRVSNRRFRDDEFLIPLNLTRGKRAIRVKVQFAPVPHPLFPGQPIPEMAWSEIRYDAYCFVTPSFKP